MALTQQTIDLEDAIDLREIKSVKLANQLLKIRRKKKMAADQQAQQANIQAQAQANAEAQQVAAQAEVQKQEAITQQKLQLEKAKSSLEIEKLLQEVQLKKELMNHEFMINMRLKNMEMQTVNQKEKYKEDRKDQRTKIQASQQSELIDQRYSNIAPN